MTNWKNRLPGHDPGEDSWKKIEKSLRAEEQLRRELRNLPEYEPDEACWEKDIVPRLSVGTRRFQWQRWAAAAAVLIIALTSALFFMRRNHNTDDRLAGRANPNNGQASVDTASNTQGVTGNRSSDENHGPEAGDRTANLPALTNSPEEADVHSASARTGIRSVTGQPEAPSGRESTESHGVMVDTALLAGIPSTISPSIAVPSAAPPSVVSSSSAEKVAGGRHRVIRIQWKVPEKPGLTFAGRPDDTGIGNKHDNDHLIKIKL